MIKTYDGRFVPKGDTEENWNKAVGFVPLDKEIIIYKADNTHPTARFKVGDGKTVVQDLPVANSVTQSSYNIYSYDSDGRAGSHTLSIGGYYMAFGSSDNLMMCKSDGTPVIQNARHIIIMTVPYSQAEKNVFVAMGMYFYDGSFSITNPKMPMEFVQVQLDAGSYITMADGGSDTTTFTVAERL